MKEEIIRRARERFLSGFHCSESIVSSVGEACFEDYDPRWVQMATAFGGGLAEKGDLCGAVVGSAMVLGLFYGRQQPGESDAENWKRARQFYDRFRERFPDTSCRVIQESTPGGWRHEKCAATVEEALKILFELIEVADEGE